MTDTADIIASKRTPNEVRRLRAAWDWLGKLTPEIERALDAREAEVRA